MSSPALPAAVLPLEVRSLDIDPMIWRRVLVPEPVSLCELHDAVRLAMARAGIRLFGLAVHGMRYAELSPARSPQETLNKGNTVVSRLRIEALVTQTQFPVNSTVCFVRSPLYPVEHVGD